MQILGPNRLSFKLRIIALFDVFEESNPELQLEPLSTPRKMAVNSNHEYLQERQPFLQGSNVDSHYFKEATSLIDGQLLEGSFHAEKVVMGLWFAGSFRLVCLDVLLLQEPISVALHFPHPLICGGRVKHRMGLVV